MFAEHSSLNSPLGVRAVHRGLVGDGLTILSTSTIEEARQAMEEEPPRRLPPDAVANARPAPATGD